MARTVRMPSVRMAHPTSSTLRRVRHAHQRALPLHQCLASVAGMSEERLDYLAGAIARVCQA